MKAILNDHVIAESDDIIECQGYSYFPRTAVRMEWLTRAPKTDSDRACPHGVQFYDVAIADLRAPRAAWSYEAPQPSMKQVENRISFWQTVNVQ